MPAEAKGVTSIPSDLAPVYDGPVLKRLLVPINLGYSAARHLAWYVSYQVTGESR